MAVTDLPQFIQDNYEVHEWKHATAILKNDFPSEYDDIITVLSGFQLLKSHILTPGGGKSPIAKVIDTKFFSRGWIKKTFQTSVIIDQTQEINPTHEIDCYKNRVALEVEWNNKDPFYDRDLNNFRVLFDLRAISLGIIITRCDELQDIFDNLGKGASYGPSTTHMSKLLPRIKGGGGGGCPILVFGICKKKLSRGCTMKLKMTPAEDFAANVEGKFGTILADPPWRFSNRTGKIAPEHKRLNRYDTLTFKEIRELPIKSVLAEQAHLYLWVPNALLQEGLEVMKAWGFTYKTNIIWHKIRKDGGPDGRGVGFYFRNTTEMILFGIKGKLRTSKPGRTQVNIIKTRKREHSRKPDELYKIIEACSPGPYLELFARGNRRNWMQWGNEVEDYKPDWPTYANNSYAEKLVAGGIEYHSVRL